MSSSRAGFCGQTSIIFYVLAFLLTCYYCLLRRLCQEHMTFSPTGEINPRRKQSGRGKRDKET